jgi:hypothetical protein
MFADANDAARAVVHALKEEPFATEMIDPLVVGITTAAEPIVQLIASEFKAHETAIVDIDPQTAALTGDRDPVARCDVIVTSLGVETGRSAVSVYNWLRGSGAERIILAVPVCPRQVETHLVRLYDHVIAVDRPLGRRSLQWHYAVPLQ